MTGTADREPATSHPRRSSTLSIVLPAFNEAPNLPRAVAGALGCRSALPSSVELHEVVVVDDGSTDHSVTVLEEFREAEPRLKLIKHRTQQGLGAAIRSGFAATQADIIVYTDADVPVELSEIGPAVQLALAPGVGLVAGFRNDMKTDGLRRRTYSAAYRFLVRHGLGLHVRDVNFALKVVTAEALGAVQLESDRSFIDAELVARVTAAGFLVEEIGFDYQPRIAGESTLGRPKEIAALVREAIPMIVPLRRSTTGRQR